MGESMGAGGLTQGGTEGMTWDVMGVSGGAGGRGGGTTCLLFLEMAL